MNRATVAIVVGYVSTLVVGFIGLSVAYVVLGTDAAFQPESLKPSGLWISIVFAISFVAAALGAITARVLAPGTKAALQLADVVFVLGLFFGFAAVFAGASATAPRTGELSVWEALTQAHSPVWVALLSPLVAKVGVYFGAFLPAGTLPAAQLDAAGERGVDVPRPT